MKIRLMHFAGDKEEIECESAHVNPAGWLIIEFKDGSQRWVPPHLIYGKFGVEVTL